jgi:hypothetical protein
MMGGGMEFPWEYDLFISHASEDSESVARPLARELKRRGVRVWFDEFALTLGDSLRRTIDRGLATSRYGLVILSPAFFAKEWPQRELEALTARQVGERVKVILPVWHNVTEAEVRRFSPALADALAVSTAKGVPTVVEQVMAVLVAAGIVPIASTPSPVRHRPIRAVPLMIIHGQDETTRLELAHFIHTNFPYISLIMMTI